MASDAAAVGSLLVLQLVFWWRAAVLRGFYLASDACFFFEPMKSFLHERLRAGHLALWSPYVLSGYPVGAEGQIATFYPPSLLFSWLLDGGGAINWLLISHLMLAAVGMYLLSAAPGGLPFRSLVGGRRLLLLRLPLRPSPSRQPHLYGRLVAASHSLRGPRVVSTWPLRRPSCPCLGGHGPRRTSAELVLRLPDSPLLAGLAGGAGAANERKTWWIAARILVITFGLGVGLAAVQLLLTRDLSALAPHGDRGTIDYVTSFSLLGNHLFGIFSPNWQGSVAFADYHGERYYWEYVLYVGLLPFLLACIGGAGRRGWALAGFAVGALVLALAVGNPLWQVLRQLPGFGDFRAPARLVLLFTFGAALLAGLGWDRVAGWLPARYLRLAPWLVALLVLADLWAFDKPLASLASADAYHHPNPFVHRLESDPGWWRALVKPPVAADAEWKPEGGWAGNPNGWAQIRAMLGADIPQAYDLRTTEGYVGFVDPEHAKLMGAAEDNLLVNRDVRFYSLLGARYLILPPQFQLPIPRFDTPGFAIFRNPNAFPRAFGVGEVRVADTRDDALTSTADLAAHDQFRQVAVIHGSLGRLVPRAGAVVSIVKVEELRPEEVRVTARSDRDALLLLDERWDPGWVAFLDGVPESLVEADSFLMGAPLPQGEHKVEFVYTPRGLTIGLPVTLASLGVCLVLILLPTRKSAP